MEIPVIDFGELNGEKRSETMALLHEACEKWGFFQIENHGIDTQLMGRVKQLVNQHYEVNMKKTFYESDIAKSFKDQGKTTNIDWERTFFVWHRQSSKINDKTIEDYVDQLIKLAEKLSELMCENLGLDKSCIKETFSGENGPSVGTKVAKYPRCPNPELVRGLREHTDAGGIILMLHDDEVPGLQFYKDGRWVEIPPSKDNIFVNTGELLEVLTNGRYKGCLHRVMADENGSRLSIATFYNPAGDATISPAPKLLYPSRFRFQDYLKLYAATKFEDKGLRFECMKEKANGHQSLPA
ncbi:hypothetical protein RJ640_021624 [Escallonia rubra]|uniref:aminocyclopropanecarboxylate oxidase n=1 Tax=Escallonia rubra TaxID=112253 RepID=A0AA88UPN7_9ASTE|nr:hypothetical protein RJ640_021624 [Escallonia rubra]